MRKTAVNDKLNSHCHTVSSLEVPACLGTTLFSVNRFLLQKTTSDELTAHRMLTSEKVLPTLSHQVGDNRFFFLQLLFRQGNFLAGKIAPGQTLNDFIATLPIADDGEGEHQPFFDAVAAV